MQKRKGFTLVELVIVIAVIAILAGVLIGTFASVINRANASAEVQKTKSEEIAQKAEDILKKIEDSNWYGWEDFEVSIVEKITKELKNQSSGLTAEQVKKIIDDALTTWEANKQAGNTELTADQVKAIVENAVGTLHYEGVTEAQVRAIIKASEGNLSNQMITPAQIKQIVTAANANNLTAAQVASVVTNSANNSVEQIVSALNNTVEGLATSVQVEDLRNEIKKIENADNDTVVIAKALNIMAKKKGLTSVETPTELFEKIGSYEKSNLKYVTAENKTNVIFDLATARFSVVDSYKNIVYSEDLTETVDSVTYWVFVENYNDSLNYSQYLISQDADTLIVDTGVDVGECRVSSLEYTNLGSAQIVVIRTNGANTTLNINAPSDTVEHYGLVGVVNIEAIDDSSSYHEHDTANLIQVANGRVALENGSKVSKIHLTATEGNFNNITVAKTSNVKMPEFSRDPVEIPSAGKKVVALQEGTEKVTAQTHLDYVWLTNVGVYEQVTIGTKNSSGTDYAATSTTATQEQKTTAQQIANNIIATIGEDSYTVTATYNTDNSEWEYNLVDKSGNDTAFVVETVSVSVSEGSATASITVTGQTANAVTSNNTNDTADMVDNAKNTVVEVTFKGQKTLLGMSEFRDKWNNGDFYDEANPVSVKLLANCNLKEENWGPIGTWKYPFFGTFDGNDKTISNLTNHEAAVSNGQYTHVYSIGNSVGYGETYGFFGIVGGGDTTIQNVTFESVNINVENGKNVGAIIGYVPKKNAQFNEDTITTTGSVTLMGVAVNGSVQSKNHVAGLIGKMYSSGDLLFENCVNNASITSSADYCGGLVAYSTTTTTFTSCTNTGAVHSGSGSVGGLLGRTGSFAVTFDTCTNTGNIESTNSDSYVGGLVGYSNGNAVLTFKKCNNSGNITGTRSGGFFGGTDNATTRVCFIETAVNSGTITGSFASNFIGNLSGACDWETGTSYDTNYVGNNPNVAISCIKHSGVVFTTVDANKLVATNGKIAKYWIISSTHGAIVNNLESETFETTYDATCVNNSKF